MRIISWNLGHRTRGKRIPDDLILALQDQEPDVVILNEYVHGTDQFDLVCAFSDMGLPHISCSTRIGRHNQVLIASRTQHSIGDLPGSAMPEPAAASNFLHVRVATGLEIVGIRVPSYRGMARRQHWNILTEMIQSTSARKIAWIGDFNANPEGRRHVGDKHLHGLENDGWSIPRAEGEWSFYRGSRIDHALISKALKCQFARYITAICDRPIIGIAPHHVSDHAALLVELDDCL